MSYDIRLAAADGSVVLLEEPHQLTGGTYCMGGTPEAWLNVTYNYAPHYYRVLDAAKGIRRLYGMTAAASIPWLQRGIDALGQDVHPDYWQPTEGNARAALVDLQQLAKLAPPDSVWEGD